MVLALRLTAISLDIIGTLMIAIAVLRVHSRIGLDRSIDKRVVSSIKKESILVYIAIVLLIAAFALILADEIIGK